MDTVLPSSTPGRFEEARSPRPVMSDLIPVVLYEDPDGRLVVVDARAPRAARPGDAELVRVGRTRLALHHLAPTLTRRLLSDGRVTVDGPDALNVLLAFATGLGVGPADAY